MLKLIKRRSNCGNQRAWSLGQVDAAQGARDGEGDRIVSEP